MPAAPLLLLLLCTDILRVGPGQTYDRPEAALAAAHAGDTIQITAPAGQSLALSKVALRITTPSLTICGEGHITLDGDGFDYSGAGPVPRAIIQIDAAGSGAVIEGLMLRSAHNQTGNGAGLRINAADSVTVRRCEITGCDMGVMSNGAPGQARGQRFESCDIHSNGSEAMKGFSHNLYLGGEDVTLEDCTIHDSTRGHNLKSRARTLRAVRCRITNSAEREIDLVDADVTAEGADALFEDCQIEKRPETNGNRAVIHFGQDGGKPRAGTLTLRRCHIVTSYISPVVTLSSPGAKCRLESCRIENPSQSHAELISIDQDPKAGRATGRDNTLSPCYNASILTPDPP